MKTLNMAFIACLIGSFPSAHSAVKHGLIHTPAGPQKAHYEKQGIHYITEWDIQVEP